MQQGFSKSSQMISYFYRFLLITGLLSAFIHLALFFIPQSTWLIVTITKVIPCLFLSIWVFSQSRYKLLVQLVAFALFFNTIGDFLLELPGDFYFILGIVANLIGHIFYIISFTLEHPELKIKRYIPALIYFVLIMFFFIPVTNGAMRIAIIVYAFIIVTMAWRSGAAIRAEGPERKDEQLRFIGALFFIICDTFIAINVFISYSFVFQLIIMVSYWIGQVLIARSTLRLHVKNEKKGN
ncbi:MAG: lysoplasmalogenase [Spirochaetales bacterium]|nr:lysoplasmalogenase [Spirochaetales bacterium]